MGWTYFMTKSIAFHILKPIPFYIKCTADWRAYRRFWLANGHTPYLGRYECEVTIDQRTDPFSILPLCIYVQTRIGRLRMERRLKPTRPLPLP